MLRCLQQAVEIESPSRSKVDVDRMARFFAKEFERCQGRVQVLDHRKVGSAVLADFFAPSARTRDRAIMLIGHTDTVWDRGMLARMQFRICGGLVYGPGILDMKSGIVCGMWAIRALQFRICGGLVYGPGILDMK